MGWCSGSELASEVWDLFVDYVPADKKEVVAHKLVRMFEEMDCDTMYECDELYDLAMAFREKRKEAGGSRT